MKRYDMLIDALVALKPRHPALRAVIVGEGYCRPDLEAQIRAARAEDWISLPGRIDDDEVIDLYRRAWVLSMIVVARRVGDDRHRGRRLRNAGGGHAASRVSSTQSSRAAPGCSPNGGDELAAGLHTVLSDDDLRARLGAAAREHAARFTWEATARGTLEVLAKAAIKRRTNK